MTEQTWQPLSKLTRLPRNAKAHDLGAVHTSIDAFGFIDTITINRTTGRIIGGHGRVDALQQQKARGKSAPRGIREQGGEWLVPALMVDIPAEQEEAAAIALNRSGERGGWDDTTLAAVLADLAASNEEMLHATGFDGDDLDALLAELGSDAGNDAEDPGAQMDRAEELNEKWEVQPGDLWEIPSQATPGKAHRILCGDSTSAADVERLMGGERADAVVTDPPYGCNFDPTKKRGGPRGGVGSGEKFIPSITRPKIIGDNDTSTVKAALGLWIDAANIQIWWGANYYTDALKPSQCWFVWDKENTGDFADIEMAWCNQDRAARLFRHMWNGMVKASEVGERRLHGTQKPIALFEWCINEHTQNSKIIADPFLGSGTTLVACERTGRVGYGMEIEPNYVAVALERLAGLGLEPRKVDKVNEVDKMDG